jgi:ABC-type glycerol-3-phosphate transport system substrate-binding protein
VPKEPYGQAGILRYLLSTAAVVPSLLPDIAFVDVAEVDEIVQAGLAQPLDSLLSPDLVADLYPFAREACSSNGMLYCLQLQADLDHLVYNSFRLGHAPVSWTGVLTQGAPYVFPAAGQGGLVNDAFLIQSGAVGPRSELVEPGAPLLDEPSLLAALRFYRDGLSRGILPESILDFDTTDDAWQAYRAGSASMAQVSAHRYLTERDQVVFAKAAPIPSKSGPAAPIGRGWALVLLTSDPARQAAAARFLEQWMSPEVNAAWNQAAGTLPTRQAAMARWDLSDPYLSFLQQQLLIARARPTGPGYNQVAAALQQAVQAVLTGELSPEEAAVEVIEGVP